ncbi:hypothetical protein [Enterobacter mori]|uniref:hypothetical protein n=1 Tax=Enterobacter mori TaxID=539813 RepID=UPI002B1FF7EF|nr:hypothetical protein [Enterobacter mori]MEA5206381.1 hypothetical protein [Enterobacter mori]
MDDFHLDFFVSELKKTFSHKIGRVSIALQGLCWQNELTCLNCDHPGIGKVVDEIVQSKLKRVEFEQNQYRMLFEEVDIPREAVNKRIYLSAVNWYLGLHLVASDWRDGVRLLLKSIELLDMCYGIVEHESWLQIETEKKERAAHGGKAKAALYAPLKVEIIRLLYCNKPNDGWKNRRDALKSIDKDICKFIDLYGCTGSGSSKKKKEELADLYSRIPRMIEDWSREDSIVKAAFDATLKQKKKSAPKGAV